MVKRIAILVVSAAAIATLAACNPVSPPQNPETAAPTKSVGLCWGSAAWVGTGPFVRGDELLPARCSHQPHVPTYRFMLQGDGNAVLTWLPQGYAHPDDEQVVWASGTGGHPYDRAVLQTDGNLVIYSRASQALWDSGTAGCGAGERMMVSNAVTPVSGPTGTGFALENPVTQTPPNLACSIWINRAGSHSSSTYFPVP